MSESKMSIYSNENKSPFWIVFAVAILGVAVSVVTLLAAYHSLCEKDAFYLYIVIALWSIGPPVWFWIEYFTIYLRWGKPDSFNLFKYGQQVAAAIWAGMLALLLTFAASGAIDPSKEVISLERCQSLCGVDKCKKVERGK